MAASASSVLVGGEAAPGIANGRWRGLATAIVGAELILLYAPTVAWLWDRWTMSVWHNAHGMFVPLVVFWLARQELTRHPELRSDSGTAWGFAVLLPALGLVALDAGIHTQLLSAISLVAILPGLSLLFLGVRRTKRLIFPLAFSLFALPIPLAVTEAAHLTLRQLTAVGTTHLLGLLRVPVFLEGTTLQLITGKLMVIDACSGFSTLYASMAVACLTAYTAASRVRGALAILAAPALAMAANILRITGLALMVAQSGFDVLDTWLHPFSGMLTFAVALPLIFYIGGPVRRG